jgi:uncharacterized C2H2 Zn-finger protein
LVVGPKIRERLDELKTFGATSIDIRESEGDTTKRDMMADRHLDTGFSNLSDTSTTMRVSLCPVDGTKFQGIKNGRTGEVLLVCPQCGRHSNPRLDPIEYATRINTKEGVRTRKGTTAKSTYGSSDIVETFSDEVDRDIYKDRKSIFTKKLIPIGDDKLLERQSGLSITEINEVIPNGA